MLGKKARMKMDRNRQVLRRFVSKGIGSDVLQS